MKTDKQKQTKAGGADYTLVRTNRKTLGVEVRPGGVIIVHAPLKMPEAEIRAFLETKADWIARSKEKLDTRRVEPATFAGLDGEALPYLGGTLTLTRREGMREPRVEGETLVLPLEAGPDTLVRWLRQRAVEELNPRLRKFGELLGVSFKSARLSDARTRWGMCSGKDSVNLSWRLIFCTPEAIDYVVAHELCHVRHKNHGRDFYAELERLLPDRKRIERWLKDNGKLIMIL